MACHHHFIYETPNGKKSKGICKFCGAKREDTNSFDEAVNKANLNWNSQHYPESVSERHRRMVEVYNRK